ncbi:hypothetical protein E1297_04640 [Roseibium sp. RKSG952]|nr:hypothetical protein [Roseibium sp. RKSG952]
MASKKTLNAKNLERLGAKTLAALLIEISTGSAEMKRRLRMELAGAESHLELAKEIRKRLATLARSDSFIDWHKRGAVEKDLLIQKNAIIEKIAPAAPKEALELMWQFMGLASHTLNRCDDSSGVLGGVFREACDELGQIAVKAALEPKQLAGHVFEAVKQNDFGQYDSLIQVSAPALGETGLNELKGLIIAWSNEPLETPAPEDRVVIGWGSGGKIYADVMYERARMASVQSALQEIADASGDVDAFIAQYDEKARKVPKIAAAIAGRLLAAGRAEEALKALDAGQPDNEDRLWFFHDSTWEDTRIAVLEALGKPEEAQAVRWACFEQSLSKVHLRAYLNALPDFEDFEAERKALAFAENHKEITSALWFLTSWPALDRAAGLVIANWEVIDGCNYQVLSPAAEALAEKHPLSATLLLRAMVEDNLEFGRSGRYKHSARHLMECRRLATRIEDFGSIEPHHAFETRLKAKHGRKTTFWMHVK